MKSSPMEEKRDSIKELKTKLQQNISDEDASQRTYSDQLRLAQKVGKAAVEYILKDIGLQESKHADMFRRAIKELEQEEVKITTEIEVERKKKEQDDRRKREDEQRRAPPLSEGYHGPYRLRR